MRGGKRELAGGCGFKGPDCYYQPLLPVLGILLIIVVHICILSGIDIMRKRTKKKRNEEETNNVMSRREVHPFTLNPVSLFPLYGAREILGAVRHKL